jgi:hypothetical protein
MQKCVTDSPRLIPEGFIFVHHLTRLSGPLLH